MQCTILLIHKNPQSFKYMLQVENISFSYRRGKKDVLDDFSLSLEKGRVYGLLGKNGAGKSTLLYLMSGLLTPKHGKVIYHDVDVRRRLPITLQDMFLVPEEFELPAISLVSYVELNSPFYPRFSKEDMMRYLHFFEMEQDINLGALSMGQKKKVFMSFALATNTSLLLMDEPTNGLDIPGKSQFRKFIASGMSDDKTIVVSTHQVRDIDKILDHVLIMDNKHVMLDASTTDICRKLLFVESDNRELAQKALYALPSVQGNYLMLPNADGEESEINLELLFGAVLSSPGKIADMFHSNK
ncbi:ABC transporter related protein [Bacteroides heparinolyticus]|uniref:ABC transporter related protein n=7 Tax=Prevotella heparinolytica TaxID=28113 RepID=A0A449I112_9BACE|nr:ABC transporter related protein [Bacteroides heparinolyticus]